MTVSVARRLSMSALALSAPLSAQTAVPFSETVHGIVVQDEYRWMEDKAKDAEMRAWVRAESTAARAKLEALPTREAFRSSLKEIGSNLTRVRAVTSAGDTTAFRRTRAGDRFAHLVVRQNGAERVLIDPNRDGDKGRAISNMTLSPDGKRIAVHQAAAGGGEVGALTVYDVATGTVVGQPIDNIWGEFELTWLGGDDVAFTQMAPKGSYEDPIQGMVGYVASLSGKKAPVPVLGPKHGVADFQPKDFPLIAGHDQSDWVAGLGVGARADFNLWIARKSDLIAGNPKWTPIATLSDQVGFRAITHGDSLYTATTKTNGAGTLQMRTLGATGPGTPQTIWEGGEGRVLTSYAVTDAGVHVLAETDGVSRLWFAPHGSKEFAEIALPFEGQAFDFGVSQDGKRINFGLTGWLTNLRFFEASGAKLAALGIDSDTWPGARDFVAERSEAVSRDGTKVPLVVIRKRGALPAGGMPTILNSYGAYGVSSTTPAYARLTMPWIAKGGAYAYCGVRGGGERGRAWHEGGRAANKPNAHDDFNACAERLKTTGVATKAGVIATGASAGGLLVPPAVLKRPDLYAAMVPAVAIVNPIRLAVAPNGANQFDEMGNPNTPEGFKALLSQDAYMMLASARTIPDTLATIGLNDNRVAPWFSAKFAARAKAKFGTQRTIWLRADDAAGHGIGTADDVRINEEADIYAFAWDRATR